MVAVEKLNNEKPGAKLRLAVRGDQEAAEDMRTNSPTINKVNGRLFFCLAASIGWNNKMCDIKRIFLQGAPLDRVFYDKLQKERRIKRGINLRTRL